MSSRYNLKQAPSELNLSGGILIGKILSADFFGPSCPPSRVSLLSFAMWRTAFLVEWLSPIHYLSCCGPWRGYSLGVWRSVGLSSAVLVEVELMNAPDGIPTWVFEWASTWIWNWHCKPLGHHGQFHWLIYST